MSNALPRGQLFRQQPAPEQYRRLAGIRDKLIQAANKCGHGSTTIAEMTVDEARGMVEAEMNRLFPPPRAPRVRKKKQPKPEQT